MKNSNQLDINKAISAEIIGSGFRKMKNRFKKLSSEFETGNVINLINEHSSSAAFSGFAKVANSPLPIEEKTLREFLAKDRNEPKTNKEKTGVKTNNKKDKDT
jgi:hypothetical protein